MGRHDHAEEEVTFFEGTKNAPPTSEGKWGIFRGRISRRSILSNINTLVARIDLPRGAAEISNYVEFYTIRAVSDPIPQAINYE